MKQSHPDFDALADAYDGLLVRTHMMGRPALKADRELVAFFQDDGAGFKLGRDTTANAEALALPGAALFSPGDSGRLWPDWVKVPVASSDHWPELLQRAVDGLS